MLKDCLERNHKTMQENFAQIVQGIGQKWNQKPASLQRSQDHPPPPPFAQSSEFELGCGMLSTVENSSCNAAQALHRLLILSVRYQ
eukprot:2257327-Amphidinium_carterae.1